MVSLQTLWKEDFSRGTLYVRWLYYQPLTRESEPALLPVITARRMGSPLSICTNEGNLPAQDRGTAWIILNYLQRKFHGGNQWNIRRRLRSCCWDLLRARLSSICVECVRIRVITKLRWNCMQFEPCEYLTTCRDRRKIDNHILYKPKNILPCYFPILSVRIEKYFPFVLTAWWQRHINYVFQITPRHDWRLTRPAAYPGRNEGRTR